MSTIVPGGQTPPDAPPPAPAPVLPTVPQTPPVTAPIVPAAAGQTPAPAPVSQPAQPATPATPAAAPAADDDPLIKLSEARRLRQEAEANRKRNEELAALVKKYEDERLTADQRLQRDLAEFQRKNLELERQNQELRIRTAVTAQATVMGFHDPEDAAAMLRWTDLQFDSAGNPTNVPQLLHTLKTEKSYLVRPDAPPPVAALPPASAPPPPVAVPPTPQASVAPRPPTAPPAVPPANPAQSAAGPQLTLEQAKQLAQAARRSGDYSEYIAHQTEIQNLLAAEARKYAGH